MFLSHGRQDKQHPNHRNKISFQRRFRYYQLPPVSPPTHFRNERSSRRMQPDRSAWATFCFASGSSISRLRYSSYAARLGKSIKGDRRISSTGSKQNASVYTELSLLV
jgi:hypothetical protein